MLGRFFCLSGPTREYRAAATRWHEASGSPRPGLPWQRLTLFTHGSICIRPCRHLDIEDLWHMEGDVDWVKCRKAFQDGELQCPPDAIKQIRTITG